MRISNKVGTGNSSAALRSRLRMLVRPGLGLKRWLALTMLGLVMFGLGVGFAMAIPISSKVLIVLRTLTLGGYPPLIRGAVFVLMGSVLGGFSVYRAYKWIVAGISIAHEGVDIFEALDQKQYRGRGRKIVAIGGGNGVSTLLRGLKLETSNLKAIVTIADDGGSSGILRKDLGMPAPGDARNCLIALSEAEPLLEELFDYRFKNGSGLNGHSLGNLLLAALYEKRSGLHEGLAAAAQLLRISGRVVPVSNDPSVEIVGEMVSGTILRGESAVGHASEPLRRVWIEPDGAIPNQAAVEAIGEADIIVIGPGSLYTSIIPNFLFQGIQEALAASLAPKVFVCNVATQPDETDGYGVEDHLMVFQANTGVAVTHVLVNSNVRTLPSIWNQVAVQPVSRLDGFDGQVVMVDVVDDEFPTRHDPMKIAQAILEIY